MARLEFKQLLDAGVHFGHLRRKWNPNMAPYIFDEKKGIHIIDLNKTAAKLEEALDVAKAPELRRPGPVSLRPARPRRCPQLRPRARPRTGRTARKTAQFSGIRP